MQPFTQQQEEKGNPEISSVQAENPETVESVPEVVSKDEIHIEERPFWGEFCGGEKRSGESENRGKFCLPLFQNSLFWINKAGLEVSKEGKETPYIIGLDDYDVPCIMISHILNDDKE